MWRESRNFYKSQLMKLDAIIDLEREILQSWIVRVFPGLERGLVYVPGMASVWQIYMVGGITSLTN